MPRNRILFAMISVVLIASAVTRAQTSEWVWAGGSNSGEPSGVYGTQGVAAAGNIPGARSNAFTWTDTSGNLWLFGGQGKDYVGTWGELNDLWEFNPLTNEWTWVSGSETANTSAVYGSPGVPTTSNIPGPRDSGVAWTDKNGNLWLFGGHGCDFAGKLGYLNDLWYYNPSSQEWTWVNGSNAANSKGSYGTQGAPPTPSNVPGARGYSGYSGGFPSGWTDNDGNLWLFGGYGEDSSWAVGVLNDLWEYSLASGEWAWVSGSKTVNGIGVYGTQGVAGAGNTPSARTHVQEWKDESGNFWLYGGGAPDVICPTGNGRNMCADSPEMWEFNPVTKEWTWISGQDSAAAPAVYGTLGVASDTSNPGGRDSSPTWIDAQGNLWLYGGYADVGQPYETPSDLWMYNTATNQWTWVGGSANHNNVPPGVYGALGVPAATNWPETEGIGGSTETWVDAQGNFWLFSGYILPNDLWVYHASPAATPTFNVSSGTFTTTQSVKISDTTPGTTIYYTTNGTTPTASSAVYSAQLTVASTETIEAVAIASGYPMSAVASETYIIAPPTYSVSNGGAITVGQDVTIGNTSTIMVTPSNGFTGAVSLSCAVTTAPSSATSPVTCSIPSSVGITGPGAQTATLTANSTSTTTTGAYAITVTAQSGSITQTTVVNVSITPAPGFTTGPGGTNSMTVTPGSTTGTTGTISIVGTNGFSGTVNLSCSVTTAMSGVRDMPTCSLNPISVTISGTTAQSSTITFGTTAATIAENHIRMLLWPPAGGTALALVAFFVSPRRRRNWLALLGAFVLLAVMSASGCGQANSAGPSNPGTTAGTYTVSVTGTGTSSGSSSAVTATVGTISLTVN